MGELLDDLTGKGLIAPESRVTLVDDGSRDKTWEVTVSYTHLDVYKRQARGDNLHVHAVGLVAQFHHRSLAEILLNF